MFIFVRGLRDLGPIKEKDRIMRGSNAQPTLLGDVGTEWWEKSFIVGVCPEAMA